MLLVLIPISVQANNNYIHAHALLDSLEAANGLSPFCTLQRNILILNNTLAKCFTLHNNTPILGAIGTSADSGCVNAQLILDFILGQNFVENVETLDNNLRASNPIYEINSSLEDNISSSIYPNPNNGSFTLSYNLNSADNAIFNLYDATGKLISTYTINQEKGELAISENGLSNGVYFYTIIANNNSIAREKFIIIK